jgi:hypothetical protein
MLLPPSAPYPKSLPSGDDPWPFARMALGERLASLDVVPKCRLVGARGKSGEAEKRFALQKTMYRRPSAIFTV